MDTGFPKKIMLKQKDRARDDDSKKSHRALAQNDGGSAADFASALASPPCYFAFAVGGELLVGHHADQDDGSHHREVE